ncbi:MAG TPA: GNAT family N-acetyltransferase, partial [Pyrinomonadaceae bacterium]|nr:GNAT family N-acetyltransferase [Pyrinomonadaceae bacterium]
MSESEARKVSRPDVELRLAGPGDEETIASLILEAFEPFRAEYTPDAFDYTAVSSERVRERFTEGPTWLAFDGDEPVGTVSGLPEEERFYVRSMAVKPAAQGRRIGQKLLDALEEHARLSGY